MREKMEDKAHELYSWVGDACMDIASGEAKFFVDSGYKHTFSGSAAKYFAKYVRRNGRADRYDLSSAYADQLYDDPDTLQDLLGDRIHDEIVQLGFSYMKDKEAFQKAWNEFLDCLEELCSGGSWKKAIANLRKE